MPTSVFAQSSQLAICTTPQRPDCPKALPGIANDEFTFSRMIFTDNQQAIEDLGDRIGYPHWQADCSESEPHFIAAMKRLTHVNTNEDSQSISLVDDRLFDYPMLYIVEAGFASISEPEARNLKEYLLRGGFLLVDDFHGSHQWTQFEGWISNKSFNVVESNSSRQTPRWRGILDDDGRVMGMINWNMDLGDAWEHADMEEYSASYTATAYRLGVNYVIYSMTH